MAINYLLLSMNYFACKKVLNIQVCILYLVVKNPYLTFFYIQVYVLLLTFLIFVKNFFNVFVSKSIKYCFSFFLDLSYNRLAKVPNDSFLHLTNLTFLDLSYNKLVRLEPQSVRRLSNLRTLNISGNIHMDLHEIRDTFEVSK